MSDFFQPGIISTLHRLAPGGLERLEADLVRFNRANPIGLVLPALYREFRTPAMARIVEELRKATYYHAVRARAVPAGWRSGRCSSTTPLTSWRCTTATSRTTRANSPPAWYGP